MKFTGPALAVAIAGLSTAILCQQVSAFIPNTSRRAFLSQVGQPLISSTATSQVRCTCPACLGLHRSACTCPSCTGLHSVGCTCVACARGGLTMLFAEGGGDSETPAEPVAEATTDEAPTRKVITTGSKKSLEEFNVGDTVKGTVKTITTYGAFIEFGATTDGLLHVSRMSTDFVNDVNDILSVGQELDVTISDINLEKGQVALTLLEQQDVPTRESTKPKPLQQRGDTTVMDAVVEARWNRDQFVLGKVVSVLNFGAFVRIEASDLAEGVEGQLEGLVHISQLTAGRVSEASDVVKEGDEVSVRVMAIADGKVSMSMVDKSEIDIWGEEDEADDDEDEYVYEYYADEEEDEEGEKEEGEEEGEKEEGDDDEDDDLTVNMDMIRKMLEDEEENEEDGDDEDAWNYDWDQEEDEGQSEFEQDIEAYHGEQTSFENDPVFVYRSQGRSEASSFSDGQPDGWAPASEDTDLVESEPVVATTEPVVAESTTVEPVA